jgi:hypothetical protein
LRAALRASERTTVCQRKYRERDMRRQRDGSQKRGKGGGERRKGKLTDLRNGSNDEKDDDEPGQRGGELITLVRIRLVNGARDKL